MDRRTVGISTGRRVLAKCSSTAAEKETGTDSAQNRSAAGHAKRYVKPWRNACLNACTALYVITSVVQSASVLSRERNSSG
ncbi:hypothetical protein NP493_508g01026 [Ridgeia piscesae]|uniref:Uncharacterized protein n=1 Tax=Ridgeia piscesae TaxID=27915 RepID=A0AAD9KXK7_RIDPI|nr:hypothetical protein NP493_508g01026 [Ridgeia piscesae]